MGEALILLLSVFVAALTVLLLLDWLLPEYRPDTPGDRRRRWWRAQLRPLLPILVLILVLRGFVLEPFRIPSASMEPTLLAGDYILVDKNAYGVRLPIARSLLWEGRLPRRGEVAVFFPPADSRHFVKRIVGLPGDVIRYRDKHLFINGKAVPLRQNGNSLEEKLDGIWRPVYHDERRPGRDFTIRVSPGHYFMMGDNRDNSQDSRTWGEVPRRNLTGPAFYLWMHWGGLGYLPHFRRSGSIH